MPQGGGFGGSFLERVDQDKIEAELVHLEFPWLAEGYLLTSSCAAAAQLKTC